MDTFLIVVIIFILFMCSETDTGRFYLHKQYMEISCILKIKIKKMHDNKLIQCNFFDN